MEKVLVISTRLTLDQDDVYHLNQYLEKGWKVKKMELASTDEDTVLVVIIEKE